MQLVILHIILYPKDREKIPRVIRFLPDKVNVITGHSQKGKSALIHIIDYCLGSSECHIPLGHIRDKVDKYAIEISLADRRMFIARDNPDEVKTNLYYEIYSNEKERTFRFDHWLEDASRFKTNRDDLKNYLGQLAGFENITEKREEDSRGFDTPASFRDTSAFLFQPQNIIANPTTIFYKTDTFEHLVRLRSLFPLVLGYKSYEIIRLEKLIADLEKQYGEKERRLQDIRQQYENWQTDIYQYYTQAIALGLTQSDISIQTSTVNELKAELRAIVASIRSGNYLQAGAAVRYAEKLEQLETMRQSSVRELDEAKVELSKIEQFDRSKDLYIQQVTGEIDIRLKPIDWFLKQKGTNVCPFCDSVSDKALSHLLYLKEQQQQNKIALDQNISREFSFEKEKSTLRRRIQEIEKSIKTMDANIAILDNENHEEKQRYKAIFAFSGKLETILESLDKIAPSGSLEIELADLQRTINVHKTDLRHLAERFDKNACLEKVTQAIDPYLQSMPIEGKNEHRVRLDPDKSVNIRIENTRTRNLVFLSKIGSGANHMGYHIATLLGLHEYFQKLPETGKNNYVPSFLVFDQPSQVYFPKQFPEPDKNGNQILPEQDEDIQNTTAIFATCSLFMERTVFRTQIIILEHAPESTWKDLPNIHLVEEWRTYHEAGEEKFNALIPMEWFD